MVVKLLVHEPGTDAAVGLWVAAELRLSSRLLYAEARAALARAARAGRLGPEALVTAVQGLERIIEQVAHIEVTERVARSAGQLAERRGLRAYDAVHLASALEAADGETAFATDDRRLAEAARHEGLNVASAG